MAPTSQPLFSRCNRGVHVRYLLATPLTTSRLSTRWSRTARWPGSRCGPTTWAWRRWRRWRLPTGPLRRPVWWTVQVRVCSTGFLKKTVCGPYLLLAVGWTNRTILQKCDAEGGFVWTGSERLLKLPDFLKKTFFSSDCSLMKPRNTRLWGQLWQHFQLIFNVIKRSDDILSPKVSDIM